MAERVVTSSLGGGGEGGEDLEEDEIDKQELDSVSCLWRPLPPPCPPSQSTPEKKSCHVGNDTRLVVGHTGFRPGSATNFLCGPGHVPPFLGPCLAHLVLGW